MYNSFHDESSEVEESEDDESLDKSESNTCSDDDVSCISIVRLVMCFFCIIVESTRSVG